MSQIVDGIEITERNRFSNFVRANDADGLEDLRRWVDWFSNDGIKAVIAFTEQGGERAARAGSSSDGEGDRMCRKVAAVYRVGLVDELD